jgi:hypothetical protein
VAASLGYLETMLREPCVTETRIHTTLLGKARVERLALKAATTPDGDAVGLEQLLDLLTTEHSRRSSPQMNLGAEIAMLAARLGRDRVALKHVREVETGRLSGLGAPANVVLTLARLGLQERARRLLARLRQPHPVALIDEPTGAHLTRRLDQAALLVAKAREHPEQRAELLALGQAELGAYLRALDILASDARHPRRRSATVLLVQLLVSARLETHALSVLENETSPAHARETLRTLKNALPRELLSLDAVPPERGPSFLSRE